MVTAQSAQRGQGLLSCLSNLILGSKRIPAQRGVGIMKVIIGAAVLFVFGTVTFLVALNVWVAA